MQAFTGSSIWPVPVCKMEKKGLSTRLVSARQKVDSAQMLQCTPLLKRLISNIHDDLEAADMNSQTCSSVPTVPNKLYGCSLWTSQPPVLGQDITSKNLRDHLSSTTFMCLPLHNITTCDEISHIFSLNICTLEPIKYWRQQLGSL